MMKLTMNRMIDHTILKQDATKEAVEKIVDEAKKYNFFSVCVNPTWVKFVSERLKGTETKACTVIGFPLGANTTEVKVFETKDAIKNGADEIDMVINVGALKSLDDEKVLVDIKGVVDAAKDKALVKVIIESAMLSDEEITRACQLAKKAGADFVKTSTGFAKEGGASVHAVQLMREVVGPEMGVKASGGIHSYEQAKAMKDAGATRIGASASIAIVEGEK